MENSPELYYKVWDILVEHVGAREEDRPRFIDACLRKDRYEVLREWRFCGNLGFGGKFWRNDGRLYISCYREDMTRGLQKVINKVNGLLAEITPEGGVDGPP
jgi:hypothetical protein